MGTISHKGRMISEKRSFLNTRIFFSVMTQTTTAVSELEEILAQLPSQEMRNHVVQQLVEKGQEIPSDILESTLQYLENAKE